MSQLSKVNTSTYERPLMTSQLAAAPFMVFFGQRENVSADSRKQKNTINGAAVTFVRSSGFRNVSKSTIATQKPEKGI